MKIKLKAYAKINVSLNIIKKRQDSYHELDMVNLPLKLYDTVCIKKLPNTTNTTVKVNSKEQIKNNIVLKTIETLRKKYKFTDQFEIVIKKKVPISSGLGGGSANAAATLNGIFKLLNLNPTKEEKIKLAKSIGADVPFCLFNKPSRVQGIGEIIKPFDLKHKFSILIVKPTSGLLTKDVFKNAKFTIEKESNLEKIITYLQGDNLNSLNNVLNNDLEWSATSLLEDISIIKEQMINDGLQNVLMSGAGPAVFSIDRRSKHYKLKRKYKKLGYNVIVTRTL